MPSHALLAKWSAKPRRRRPTALRNVMRSSGTAGAVRTMSRRALLAVVLSACATWALSARGQTPFAFPLQTDSVRLAVIGDMGTGEAERIDVANQMVKARASFPFGFVIAVGDNVYTGHKSSDFDRAFAVPYKPLLDAGVQFYATLGNDDDASERFYPPFNMKGASYYTYTKGRVHFFALDSNHMGAAQIAWLETRLARPGPRTGKCYFHHPLYSSARHHGPDVALRKGSSPCLSSTAWMSCCPATTTYTNACVRSRALLFRGRVIRQITRGEPEAKSDDGEGIRCRSRVHADRVRRRRHVPRGGVALGVAVDSGRHSSHDSAGPAEPRPRVRRAARRSHGLPLIHGVRLTLTRVPL